MQIWTKLNLDICVPSYGALLFLFILFLSHFIHIHNCPSPSLWLRLGLDCASCWLAVGQSFAGVATAPLLWQSLIWFQSSDSDLQKSLNWYTLSLNWNRDQWPDSPCILALPLPPLGLSKCQVTSARSANCQ